MIRKASGIPPPSRHPCLRPRRGGGPGAGLAQAALRLERRPAVDPPPPLSSATSLAAAHPPRHIPGAAIFSGQNPPSFPDATIAKVSFAGEFQKLAEVNGLHTDFVEMDEGRIASLTWEVRQVGEWRLLGDHVVVIEADGSSRSIWNSFDSVPFVEDGDWVEGFYVPDPTVADWSHVNSVTWNAAANALMITMTAQDGVAKINAETGEMSWLYGDEVGAFGGSPGLTEAPHSAELLDDGHVLVFNRGDFLHDPINACSWAAELSVDAGTGAMTEVARWESAGCTLVTYLGSARRLPGGTTMVDWTSAGRIDQLTAADEAAWSVALSAGHAFGYADFLPLPAAGP